MKNLLVVVALVVAIAAVSFAGSTTATVTANVNAATNVTKVTDLSFGSINQGATSTITSLSAGAAHFTVLGSTSASTTCTFAFPATLANGTNTLPFTGQIPVYNNVDNTQSAATAFSVLTGGTATTSATGELFLWVGGKVVAGGSQAAGAYTGTITVTVVQ